MKLRFGKSAMFACALSLLAGGSAIAGQSYLAIGTATGHSDAVAEYYAKKSARANCLAFGGTPKYDAYIISSYPEGSGWRATAAQSCEGVPPWS